MSQDREANSMSQHRTQVDADSELRSMLKDEGSSALTKYMDLVIGRRSLLRLAWFELVMLLCQNMPGALGIVMRRKLYGTLLGRCGRGVVFGRGVGLRHPHRIRLGDRVVIDDHAMLDAKGRQDVAIDIGDDCVIGRNTVLSCKSMGSNSGRFVLAPRVNISVNCTLISESELVVGEKVLIAHDDLIIHAEDHVILFLVDKSRIHEVEKLFQVSVTFI